MAGIPIGQFKLLWSVLIALALTAIVFVYLKYTKQGYEISVVGDSSATAKYAGMSVGKIVLRIWPVDRIGWTGPESGLPWRHERARDNG